MQIDSHNPQLDTQWREWYPKVYGYFYKRVNTQFEVEELTAQSMNTAFSAKNVQNFQAYIWKVAHNYLVKYIQTKTTSPMIVGLEDWDEATGVYNFDTGPSEDDASQNYTDKLGNLKQCIQNQLGNKTEQELVKLCIYEEKNSTEVALILDLKADNVRQKLSRTLKKLRTKCRELWPIKSNKAHV